MSQPTPDLLRKARIKYAEALREKELREERARQSDFGEKGRLGGLIHFVRYFWHILEPNTPLVEGEPMYAIILHLEAVTRGEITKLLINVSPGSTKSMLVNVLWPAWEWSAAGQPWHRYVTFAYAAYLTERDNKRFLDIIQYPDFVALWGHVFRLTANGQTKPSNDAKGWKFSSSMLGVGTGERGSRILADDLHNVSEGESEAIRSKTVTWVRTGMSNRLNNMEFDVIIMIGQRVNAEDVSNAMLEIGGYIHLCIANEYDPQYHCATEWWEDPRTELGQLAWPERFPAHVTANIKVTLGPSAYSAQYQQRPEAPGGGILKREFWREYELPIGATPPHEFELIIASLDPAYTSRQENDPSGFVVFGVYRDKADDPHVVLLHAWKKWLDLHGQDMPRGSDEGLADYVARASPKWGLVEQVAHDCARLKVRILLVEDKASGHSVAQEIQRLYSTAKWGCILVDPGGLDKRARAYAVQHLFAGGMFEVPVSWQCTKCATQMRKLRGGLDYICPKCPDGQNTERVLLPREWASMVIDECVVAGTKIITRAGIKPVEDITVGDEVLTHKGRFRSVLATSRRQSDRDLVALSPKTLDTLTLTPNHPLFALELDAERNVLGAADWVPAEAITSRRYRDVIREGREYSEATPSPCHAATLPVIRAETPTSCLDLREWARLPDGRAFELLENDEFIATTHGRIQAMRWRQPLDHAFGRFCGLYLAEGYARRHQTTFAFNATTEPHLVAEIDSFIKDRLGCGVCTRTQGNCTSVMANLPLLEDFFAEFGGIAHFKKIPGWMWDAPDDFLLGVLDGYAEGDGYRAPDGLVTATTVSISLAWGIRLLALRLGIYANVVFGRAAGVTYIRGRAFQTRQSYAVSWRAERDKGHGIAAVPTQDGELIGYSIMRTSPLEGTHGTDVYNMDVAEDHSYCTTGGLVHNCAKFRGLPGDEDNIVDALTQCAKWMRDNNVLIRPVERQFMERELATYRKPLAPLYPGSL